VNNLNDLLLTAAISYEASASGQDIINVLLYKAINKPNS